MAAPVRVVDDRLGAADGDEEAERPFATLVAALAPAPPAPRRRAPRETQRQQATRPPANGRWRCGVLDRIHATGAASLLAHNVLPLLSAADLGRFEATAPAATRADRALKGRGMLSLIHISEPTRPY